jgi:hypothetical protein
MQQVLTKATAESLQNEAVVVSRTRQMIPRELAQHMVVCAALQHIAALRTQRFQRDTRRTESTRDNEMILGKEMWLFIT